ncbi:hypothetical protein M9M90_00980 [Phenylobacterium sp. LH3H17]|uniref:hypothetical protein n=1 Tax=Phenylobacterium sp. LH3H17 TaxID=2903901 RepID=UPI0020C9A065|nr:hypothetical protein [Phenylobacterium sp. LH3H17]UTP39778.1 hypothetical protein M9M90_00980 [Phenylobacterium sp. LH3H17]
MNQAYIRTALLTALGGLILGCIVFQASSMAFDYMKLRHFPLYGSAASLGSYAETVDRLIGEMDQRGETVRNLIRDRSTIDIDVAGRAQAAESAIVEARNFLRQNLTSQQIANSQFDKASVNFTGTDAIFQKFCSPSANSAAGGAATAIEGVSGAGGDTPSSAITESRSDAAAMLSTTLTPAQLTMFKAACAITVDYCDGDAPHPSAGQRAKMICTQKTLQAANRRKEAITAFNYDAAKYITDVQRLSYPSFASSDVDTAIAVTESYRALTGQALRTPCATCGSPVVGEATVGASKPAVRSLRERIFTPFWDFWLSLPLAILYLALGFIFGAIGSLSSYLYGFAAPNSVAPTPTTSPWFMFSAGGGAAILILLIVMAGFQFLTVGASSPDLAYPNPLTVCALSVVVGLRGDRVLSALQDWTGRMFSSNPPPGGPHASGGAGSGGAGAGGGGGGAATT